MSWTHRLYAAVLFACINLSVFALVPLRQRPWADEAWQAKVVENSIGMKLVRIDAGTFLMGSQGGELERNAQEHQHEVVISKPFYIGKFEVTQEEYEKIMGKNPAAFSKTGQHQNTVAGLDTRRFPIEMVSWHEAKEFCQKLTDKERAMSRISSTMAYALPTEAEWEYCCRAGTQTPFAFGDTISTDQANYDGMQNVYGNGKPGKRLNRPVPVGSYPPNPWGLHDMHGNIWEWCEDGYTVDYYKTGPKQDPVNTNNGEQRLLRGGGWGTNPGLTRSALRGYNGVGTRYDYNGFRVVLRLAKG
jgi:formylglycine-generating enzyme required for sulfatase activity